MTSLDDSTCSLPTSSPGKWEAKCQSRIEKILQMPCNQTCADCGAEDPEWASLLLSGKDSVEGLGAVVCQQCAIHHVYELGEKRSFIKFLLYSHEWTHPELDLLEFCGNDLVNEVYEATLIAEGQEKDEEEQAKFIKNKYKKCRYIDPEAMERAIELVALRAERAKFCHRNKRGSMDMMGRSKRGSMDMMGRSKIRSMDMSTQSGMNRDESTCSLISLCSELDGSDVFSLCDVVDNEEIYQDCEKCTYQGSRSNPTANCVWSGTEREVPARSASDPAAMAKALASINPNRRAQRSDVVPAKPSRRISNDPGPWFLAPTPLSKNGKPVLFRRMSISPLPDESTMEEAPLPTMKPEVAKVAPCAA